LKKFKYHLLMEIGRSRDAIASFDRAIQVINLNSSKHVSTAYALRGLNFQRQGNNQAAISDFNQALKVDPNNPVASFSSGISYHMRQDYQGAIAAYQKAIAQKPKYIPPINNIGLIKYELQDTEGAIQQFKIVLAINNNLPETQLALAAALYKKGEKQASLKMAANALLLDKRFANVSFMKKNLWGEKLIADTQKLLQNIKD
jgi:tetratricopeptide (TPR) repeat protein